MTDNQERMNRAVQLALGSDLTVGALAKLMPGLIPVAPDHFVQTLAFLALAVGLTHTTDSILDYIGRIRAMFERGSGADRRPEVPVEASKVASRLDSKDAEERREPKPRSAGTGRLKEASRSAAKQAPARQEKRGKAKSRARR
jgi:hypothetical protein